eukprot:s1884_g2.t1
MVLRDEALCEHSSFHGGSENKYYRGANGQSRYVSCKERDCEKVVFKCKRTDPSDLWRYLVMVALCTKWGQAARSRGLFQRVCQVRGEALEARERQQQLQLHLRHHGVSSLVAARHNNGLQSMAEPLHPMVDTPEPRSSDSLTSAFGFMVFD